MNSCGEVGQVRTSKDRSRRLPACTVAADPLMKLGALWSGLKHDLRVLSDREQQQGGSFPYGIPPSRRACRRRSESDRSASTDGRLAAQLAMRHTDLRC